ncbi:von Willebrand factor D and EGF domain-containing protein-like isoform X2 [Trichoplusia ni]|nr:von Willebrand factor D and EGF domain-containing protein-like isoform X2 [Trichoplusia ni]XP_026729704.1 von Willebrand factor D and EGF domain-containing protein-like isoform X2 [Trichoplusia ni]XP_026729705.1 von Willebrand factor D and EGF domain-containing protein-like isoform X2 [Trichoplusia ni]XP_026729706.1 von Willebrand factor D and EGF domain-containing protein-like isoform X2 [Trichoplusia ni]
MEAYEKDFCLFWCTDTRVATAIGTRNVKKLFPKQINVCCEGYVTDDEIVGNGLHCKPYCTPTCSNGYCKSPGVCACNPGYVPDMFDPYNCIPLCIKGCDHGTCVAPNTCSCNSGYNLVNDICEPVCDEPCYNGTCIAPNTCQCYPGYKMSDNKTCEPYCSSYTASGECVITLTCVPGWTKVIKGAVEVCEPLCTELCENGICIEPDKCECLKGYVKIASNRCDPVCSSGCLHGSCIGPETCVCDPGWYRKESSGACQAHCDYKCGNGTCSGPNVCECFPGFKLDEGVTDQVDTATPMCVPVCDSCEGSCVAPGVCVCEYPLETVLVAADGGPCNCTENCSDDETKCERTICVESTTEHVISTESTTDQRFEETTVLHDVLSTTDIVSVTTVTDNADYERSTEENEGNDYDEIKIEEASWSKPYWFYAIGSTLVLIMLIVAAAALYRKKYSKVLDRNLSTQCNDVSTVHYKKKTTA